MNRFTTFTAAATLVAFSTVATAGGLSPEIMEAPAITQEVVAAAPSVNPALIVLGVLAVLLIASGTSDNGGGDEIGCTAVAVPDDKCS